MSDRRLDDLHGDRTPRLSSEESEARFTSQDDDMDDDYELATETTDEYTMDDETADDDEDNDEEEGDEVEIIFEDAQEQLASLIESAVENASESQDQDEEEGTASEERPEEGARAISRNELLHLLARTPALRYLLRNGGLLQLQNDDEDNETDMNSSRSRRRRGKSAPYPAVPSIEGQKLMESGIFGTAERSNDGIKRQKKLAMELMRRELGLDSPGRRSYSNGIASQGLIPSTKADHIVHYDYRCYSGQFSSDGNFFFACNQDLTVRMYDTSNPYAWKYYKSVSYDGGSWTLTDASLTADNKWLAYSSMNSVVCLASTDPSSTEYPHRLQLAAGSRGWSRGFSIYSVRFSGDGREVVAGTGSNSVYVYDIERGHSVLGIQGHHDHVNAVCYGDPNSPHILFSGSDDSTIKIWDRRSLAEQREAGCFLGHVEGITYVDSKGDGRYVLSNGKDQTMKLWDLRKMISTEQAEKIDQTQLPQPTFDYRYGPYDRGYHPHPHDCSVVTYRGHRVLRTLIRCHFSPPGSTDGKYVYSGSEDGSVYIWNLDATEAGKVDVYKATKNTRPNSDDDLMRSYNLWGSPDSEGSWITIVRDASWHPHAPVIAATAWNGWGGNTGSCTSHSWNDGVEQDEADPPMGQRLNEKLLPDPRLYTESERAAEHSRMRLGNPVSAFRRSTRLARRMQEDD